MKLRDDSFNPSCGWKMTSAQVVETSVTNNSSFQNYPHPDNHTIPTTVNKATSRFSLCWGIHPLQ